MTKRTHDSRGVALVRCGGCGGSGASVISGGFRKPGGCHSCKGTGQLPVDWWEGGPVDSPLAIALADLGDALAEALRIPYALDFLTDLLTNDKEDR